MKPANDSLAGGPQISTSFADGSSGSAQPSISVIIPARNEERMLPLALDSVSFAAAELDLPVEVVVVNDGSTDETAQVARDRGARVVAVELHNIAAVRNAGARQASGELLFFLDADTQLPAQVLRSALRELERGAAGGGAGVAFDEITFVQRTLAKIFTWYWQRWNGWAAGCFMFCRREVFDSIGGFDEQYFAAEEQYFTEAVRRQGRFEILNEQVLTSGRKMRLYSTVHLLGLGIRALLMNRDQLKRRDGLEILYEAPREPAD